MEIFELAKLLGEAIKKDIRLVEFEEAKKAYENDEELQNALKEYEVQQHALQSEMIKEDKDGFTIDAINESNKQQHIIEGTLPLYSPKSFSSIMQ